MESRTEEQKVNNTGFPIGQLIPDISFETYRDADGINSHGLMDVLRSPAHFYEAKFNGVEQKETPALLFGKLFHYAILEPNLFQERYVIQPKFDMRTKLGKSELAAWMIELKPNAIIVPEAHVDKLLKMCHKILAHPISKGLLANGVRETTLFWKDRETGELCKARPDFVSDSGLIVDLKTTMDARYKSFSREIWNHDYHIQSSHYCSGAEATGVARHDTFVFLVIEKDPPYEIAVYPAGSSVLGIGEQWRSKAMEIYSRCRKENVWPGYNFQARTIELPYWAEAVDPDEEVQ